MFGFRSDGKKLKGIDPVQKIIPHIMSKRHDSQNSTRYEVRCEPLDAFIRSERQNGNNFNYMHIIIAAVLRTVALFPRLNRFVMNGRIFQRNYISVSFVVKRGLSPTANESTVRIIFKGTETLAEVRDMVNDAISKNNKNDSQNNTDNLANFLTRVPNILIKMGVGFVKWLDKHGMLPKKVIEASPFHTTFFITNLKSIKGDYIYHHLYDFGTTGLFFAMGKETMQPVVEGDQIVPGKLMNLGVVTDERFCDGFYFVSAFKETKKFFNDPGLLMTPLDKLVEDQQVESPIKKKRKEKKKKEKEEIKENSD